MSRDVGLLALMEHENGHLCVVDGELPAASRKIPDLQGSGNLQQWNEALLGALSSWGATDLVRGRYYFLEEEEMDLEYWCFEIINHSTQLVRFSLTQAGYELTNGDLKTRYDLIHRVISRPDTVESLLDEFKHIKPTDFKCIGTYDCPVVFGNQVTFPQSFLAMYADRLRYLGERLNELEHPLLEYFAISTVLKAINEYDAKWSAWLAQEEDLTLESLIKNIDINAECTTTRVLA